MPLILPSLQQELVDLYNTGKTGNPEPNIVGLKTGTAYFNYVSAGMNAGGMPFTAMPGTMNLQDELGKLYAGTVPDGQLFALKMTKAFDSCLNTFMSVFQTTIITAPGMPGLQSELMKLFSKPKGHSSLFAMALGRALNNYTVSAVVMGIIPDTPGIPFTGPIS